MKRSCRERFFWGKVWLRDFVSGAVEWEVIILFFFTARQHVRFKGSFGSLEMWAEKRYLSQVTPTLRRFQEHWGRDENNFLYIVD